MLSRTAIWDTCARRTALNSWSKFGLEAEYVVALYLKSIGWNVALSPASKGPADIVAICNSSKWFIQVKASSGIPRLKSYEVKRLIEHAESCGGLPVVSTYQPFPGGFSTGSFSILFYLLQNWRELDPVKFLRLQDRPLSSESKLQSNPLN